MKKNLTFLKKKSLKKKSLKENKLFFLVKKLVTKQAYKCLKLKSKKIKL